MQRNLSVTVLAAAIALVGLTGFGADGLISPRPLQAQACGVYTGPLCAARCGYECSNGSCCGWEFYYYQAAHPET